VSSEMVFIDTYRCPRCRAELETHYDEWKGWQRCPTCGALTLPPEPPQLPSPRRSPDRSELQRDVMVISDAPDLLMDPDQIAPAFVRPAHMSPARLVFRTGLLVSLGLMLIFFLDQNTTNTAIFGFLAIVFFVLLLRLSANRSPAR
jgi:hypothetical protein